MRRLLAALLLLGVFPAVARGDEPLSVSDVWQVRSTGPLTVDGGLVLGLPTALGTGLSSGVGAGVTYGRGLAWEARASWSTSTESSIPWTVTQDDIKLRAGAVLQHAFGRGRVGLRLGLGPTIVYESRLRNQGARAGLPASELETTSTEVFAAGDLEGVVGLHVFGPWLLALSGGPSLAIGSSGTARGGWASLIGVGWQP
jgi:hypothetical protein